MSRPATDAPVRECRDCGASLSSWSCESCGGDSFENVARLYVAELASPWRSRSRPRARHIPNAVFEAELAAAA
jgi:hypothetical protein